MSNMAARNMASYILLLLFCCVAHACQEGAPCNSTTVPKGLCIRGTCMAEIPNWDRQNLSFTITVKYPEDTLKIHGGSELYLRGNGLGYSWNKGTVIPKTSTDTWSIQVVYRSSVAGYSCQTCADMTHVIHKQFEYRVLVDDRVDMIGANFAVELPVSEVSNYFTVEKEFISYPWFYQKNGNISAVTVTSKELGGERNIALYTPPSFHENTFKVYPVIYALDFAPTGLTIPLHTFDDPIAKHGVTQEFVVIGFGNYTPSERMDFLTPSRYPYFECKNGTFENQCGGCFSANVTDIPMFLRLMITKCANLVPMGGMGDNMLDFLLNTAFPVIQTFCNNRLSTDRENIGIIGYSLGGLMSCHAAWTRPQAFGFAACQSSSFWWPIKVDHDVITPEFEFLNKTMQNDTLNSIRRPQRIYLDAGELEDGPPFRMAGMAIEAAEKMTKINNYIMNKNVWVNIYPGSPHSGLEWVLRLWKALTTLLPAQGMPNMPSAQTPPIIG